MVIASVFPGAFILTNRRDDKNQIVLCIDFPANWKEILRAYREGDQKRVAKLMEDRTVDTDVTIKPFNLTPRLEMFEQLLVECDLYALPVVHVEVPALRDFWKWACRDQKEQACFEVAWEKFLLDTDAAALRKKAEELRKREVKRREKEKAFLKRV